RTGSRAPLIVVLVLIAMAAGAAAVWFLVLRKPDQTNATSPGPVASNHPSGSAGSAMAPPHPGSGSQLAVHPAGSGSQMVASAGSNTGVGPGTGATAPPALELVNVSINSNADGAQVEQVGTDWKGPAPFDAKVEKGKTATVRVSAPGFTSQDVEIAAGDKPV